MTASLSVHALAWQRVALLRDVLALVDAIRRLDWPPQTPDDLRKLVEVLVQSAALLGLDPSWGARLRALAGDDELAAVVLAVLRYVLGDRSA